MIRSYLDYFLTFCFPCLRFNLTFECTVDIDCADVDINASGRPCLSSIAKYVGCLDKELVASGLTKKGQEYIEKVSSLLTKLFSFLV